MEDENNMSKQFMLGMNVDTYTPDEICEGWEILEIPLGPHLDPFLSDYEYNKGMKAFYSRPGYPPVYAASHFIGGDKGLLATGPFADWDQLAFWSERGFKRMAELGVDNVGIYGDHFPIPDGYSKTKAMDETLKFLDLLTKLADKYGVLVALEPMANLDTVFPRYLDGVAIAKEINHDKLKVMADLNYFLELDQPLEDILKYPEGCLHVHIQGDGGSQPNIGNRNETLTRLFSILRDIGYEKGVSAACPWQSTKGGAIDIKYESQITLDYLRDIREKVYK